MNDEYKELDPNTQYVLFTDNHEELTRQDRPKNIVFALYRAGRGTDELVDLAYRATRETAFDQAIKAVMSVDLLANSITELALRKTIIDAIRDVQERNER